MLSNQLAGVSEEEIQSNIGKYGSPSGKGEISKWRQLNEKIQYRGRFLKKFLLRRSSKLEHCSNFEPSQFLKKRSGTAIPELSK